LTCRGASFDAAAWAATLGSEISFPIGVLRPGTPPCMGPMFLGQAYTVCSIAIHSSCVFAQVSGHKPVRVLCEGLKSWECWIMCRDRAQLASDGK
jgi:hypothetical protein